MASPTHIILGNPEVQDGVPVGTKIEALSGRVVNQGRRRIMGALAGIAMAVSAPAMAQDMVAVKAEAPQGVLTQNLEYDRIIAEAKLVGKEVIPYVQENKAGWGWSIQKYISFSKYYRGLEETAAIARRNQEGQLDQAAIARRAELEQIERVSAGNIATFNSTAIKLVKSLAKNREAGTFKKSDIDTLKEMYNHKKISDEVRRLIDEEFGDLFDFKMLLAQI